MRAALYARVSTHVGQSPEMQLAELRQYCQRRSWDVAGEYVDVGVSGAKERRPPALVDASKIVDLRAQGRGWRKIAAELGVGSEPS